MASSVHIWPRLINSLEEIPQNFLKSYQLALGESNTFPYTIYLPDDKHSDRSSKELMISLSDDILFIFEKPKTQVQIKTKAPISFII
ncbi:MAG TPA: hypothetical protein VEB00_07850 [Clostridia bacterium]|nr:hypothetical protein [Clostridia bacterium]